MPDHDASAPTVVLVLQGGGALGAYQVGAYEALLDTPYAPDWLAGISIGAFNAAIIAGNAPERRLDRLTEFWSLISRPDGWSALTQGVAPRLFNALSFWEALTLGQPNFFKPRIPGPYLQPAGTPGATSFYDTAPLRATLTQVADFARINHYRTPLPGVPQPPRLSLGATDIDCGTFDFFDSAHRTIGPEHVMASGALPPGFPPEPVDGRLYWDGGCISNTPLEAVLDDQPEGHTLAFVIDVWSAHGQPPATMDDVLWRQKQIQYASRIEHGIHSAAVRHELRQHGGKRLDIVHAVYQPRADEAPNSDSEFSRTSIRRRRDAGRADLTAAIHQAPWMDPHGAAITRVFPLIGGRVVAPYTGVDVAQGTAPKLGSTLARLAWTAG